jgi:hypothetical protein
MNNELPGLRYWLGCYLHQDFDAEFASPDDALTSYMIAESSDEIKKLKHDLEEIMQSGCDEQTLRDLLLTQIGCGYYYPSEWESAIDWFCHLQETLTRNSGCA